MYLHRIVFSFLLTIICFHGSAILASKTFLFSFEQDGKKSYLLGTMHSVEYAQFPKALISLVATQSHLVVESADYVKPLDEPSCRGMDILKAPNEPSYLDRLEADDRCELLTYATPFLVKKGGHVQADQLNLKGLLAVYIGGHFLKGIDYWLADLFTKGGKQLYGLETRDDLSSFFENVDFDDFLEVLQHKFGVGSTHDQKLTETYLAGIVPDVHDDNDFIEEMRLRNAAWLDKIINYHTQHGEGMLIAVGVGHLYGQYGLINLLLKKGFFFKRMLSTGEFTDIEPEVDILQMTSENQKN